MKPVVFQGKLYAPKHRQKFGTEHSVAEIKEHPKEKDILQFVINGVSATNWFRQKYREFQEAIGIKPKQKQEMGKSKGLGM